MMRWRVLLFLLAALVQAFGTAALTNTVDFTTLKSLTDVWKNTPPNWNGDDPCGRKWDGISCRNNRVISITLASNNLHGQLSADITGLSMLQTLDLSYNNMTGPLPPSIGNLKSLSSLILVGCGFSGPIPPTIGSLQQLVFLALNSNNFFDEIPPTLGNLSKLVWLDLADNKLSGTIPVSNGTTPGLDMLVHTKHFHFGNNRLSGEIPSQLFSSNMNLIHVLLDNNRLTGTIPSSLGLVKTLEVVQLDRNSLSGSVPENINNLTSVLSLRLANNALTGPLPNLTGMDVLNYVDISNNSFDPTDFPPWFSTLQSLTSLIMENTNVRGELPVSLFSLSQLQTVVLKGNQINGTLNISSSHGSQLHLIDLQNNRVDDFTKPDDPSVQIILVGNPICYEEGAGNYCIIHHHYDYYVSSYSTPAENCTPVPCSSNKASSPTCQCAYPYVGNLVFLAPSFSNFDNSSIFASLEQKLMATFRSHGEPVDSVSLSNPTKNSNGYLELNVRVFPFGQDCFNRTGISEIGFMLSYQTFEPPEGFGPIIFRDFEYQYLEERTHKPSNTSLIIGASVGGCVLVLLLILAGAYALHQKRKAATATKKNDPFASWDPNSKSGGVPQLKGARCFSFEELKKSTKNFSAENDIGSGGYGKVYRGILPTGQLVAIKRAQQGSKQGGLEFKTEIELLSRVHHKNVVSLVGFCFDQGEQMLIYEYIPNGTLKDSFTGRSGIRLDWIRRLRIALGAARGVQYLHDLADPPIIHRDIKSNNILLDERLNAKVADFGLSKLVVDSEKGHVTTQVKGTMGYLDPEYYMTQQLSEKSDVYSFGVLLLELLTARSPIEKGKYIVREVMETMDKTKDMYNLQKILDPIVASNMAPGTVEKFVDLALRCVEDSGVNRPAISEVVKEIENIMELAGLDANAESSSTSNSYDGAAKGGKHPYTNESLFSQSGSYPSSTVEPK